MTVPFLCLALARASSMVLSRSNEKISLPCSWYDSEMFTFSLLSMLLMWGWRDRTGGKALALHMLTLVQFPESHIPWAPPVLSTRGYEKSIMLVADILYQIKFLPKSRLTPFIMKWHWSLNALSESSDRIICFFFCSVSVVDYTNWITNAQLTLHF